MAKYIVPGIYVNELDMSFSPQPVPVDAPYTLVFIVSKWGPKGQFVKVDTFNEFVNKFGVPEYDPNAKFTMAWDAAFKIISQGLSKLIVYALNDDATEAILDDVNYASDILIKYSGSYGNQIAVSYETTTRGSKTIHTLVVYKLTSGTDIELDSSGNPVNLTVLETFSAENKTDLRVKVNEKSNFITLSATFDTNTSPFNATLFVGGTDGNMTGVGDADVVNAIGDPKFLSRTEIPVRYIMTARALGPTAVGSLAQIAAGSYRKDFFIVADFEEANLDVDSMITARNNYPSDIPGSYVALFGPHIYDTTVDGTRIEYPASYFALAARLSQTSSFGYPWAIVAGVNKGNLSGEPVKVLTKDEQDDLYDNNINPIIRFSNKTLIWGNKTLGRKGSALEYIHAREATIYIEMNCLQASKSFQFEIYTPAIKSLLEQTYNRILSIVKSNNGVYDFKIQIDDTVLLQENGPLQVNVAFAPVRSLEYITLNFIIENNI